MKLEYELLLAKKEGYEEGFKEGFAEGYAEEIAKYKNEAIKEIALNLLSTHSNEEYQLKQK